MLDVARGGGHSQQGGEVGVGCVQREAQCPALEVDNGRMAGTFKSDRRAAAEEKQMHINLDTPSAYFEFKY